MKPEVQVGATNLVKDLVEVLFGDAHKLTVVGFGEHFTGAILTDDGLQAKAKIKQELTII